ncbi:MAG: helix-turn-helix transcriptional regulator [Patescibacteria group bacterium]
MTKKEYECTIGDMRYDCGISQQKLADAIGVSRQTISSIEQHVYEPTITTAIKLARYFNMPVEMLFELHEQPPDKKDGAEKYVQQYERESR